MKCPTCATPTLTEHELETNLLSLQSPTREGHWIKAFQYWKWREKHNAHEHRQEFCAFLMDPEEM